MSLALDLIPPYLVWNEIWNELPRQRTTDADVCSMEALLNHVVDEDNIHNVLCGTLQLGWSLRADGLSSGVHEVFLNYINDKDLLCSSL